VKAEQATAGTGSGDKKPTPFLQIYWKKVMLGGRGRRTDSAAMHTRAVQAFRCRFQCVSGGSVENLSQFVKCSAWFTEGTQFNKNHLLLMGRRGANRENPKPQLSGEAGHIA
jgi:hypothetical protein